MPGIGSVFDKIGASIGAKPKSPAAAVPKATTPAAGGKKPFDINLYFKAVGMYYSDLFSKKIPYFFQNFVPVMKNFPNWWNKQPQDMQISYALIVLGNVVFIAGIVMFFVM
jgi:hypothetical protein